MKDIENITDERVKINTLNYFKEILSIIKMKDKKYEKKYNPSAPSWIDYNYPTGVNWIRLHFQTFDTINKNDEYAVLAAKKYVQINDLIINLFNSTNIVYEFKDNMTTDMSRPVLSCFVNRSESLKNLQNSATSKIKTK